MLKRIGLGVAGVLGLILAGCIVPSVYPFYTDKDVVTDPALVGTWVKTKADPNDKTKWIFEKDGDQKYKATVIDSQTNIYSVHLFKLNNQTYMDAMLLLDMAPAIPPHYLAKIVQLQPTMKLSLLNVKWVQEYIDKHPDAIRHTMALDDPDDNTTMHAVLTADTKELQAFILKHADDKDFFAEFDEMRNP